MAWTKELGAGIVLAIAGAFVLGLSLAYSRLANPYAQALGVILLAVGFGLGGYGYARGKKAITK